MRKIILAVFAFAGLTVLGSTPSLAYGDGPWCAVSSMGRAGATERCDFYNFEACRMEIIAGNRGFCRQNGYFIAKTERPHKTRRHHVYR
jgi:hypothetical protein